MRVDPLFYLNKLGHQLSGIMNRLFPGKLRANLILVANERSKKVLPARIQGKVEILVENGVDLSLWQRTQIQQPTVIPRFLYVGRLVPLKAVDILVEAFFNAAQKYGKMELHIIGDGEEKAKLEQMTRQYHSSDGDVIFHGWMQQADIPAFEDSKSFSVTKYT